MYEDETMAPSVFARLFKEFQLIKFPKLPGVRTIVTYSLLAIVGYAGIEQLPDNDNILTLRRLAEMAVVFYFAKSAQADAGRPRE